MASEFRREGAGPGLVLAGGFVQLSTVDLPYAPFAAALREVARERGAAQVAALHADKGAA